MQGIFFKEFTNSYIPQILQEIYIEKIYEPFLHGKKDLTIFDIGGNIGLFSYYAYPYAKKIICMEPSKDHVEVIKHMLEYNKMDDKVGIVNAALSSKSEIRTFYHNKNNTMYSLEKEVNDGSYNEKVTTMTLSDLMLLTKTNYIDFMKLDIEGSEFDVINSTSFETMSTKIDSMLVELHAWAGRNPSQITTTLKDYGFEVWHIPAQATLFGAKRK